MKKIKVYYALNIGLNVAILAIFIIADILSLINDQSATLSFYLGFLGSACVIASANLVVIFTANYKLQFDTPRQYACKALCGFTNSLLCGFAISTLVTMFENHSINDLMLIICTYLSSFSTVTACVMSYLLKKER